MGTSVNGKVGLCWGLGALADFIGYQDYYRDVTNGNSNVTRNESLGTRDFGLTRVPGEDGGSWLARRTLLLTVPY